MFILFIFILFGSVEERGITVMLPEMETKVVGDETDKVIIGKTPTRRRKYIVSPEVKGEWELIDSCLFYGRVPAGKLCLIEIDSTFNFIPPDSLTSGAMAAIEIVPDWLKLPLFDNFSRMETSLQNFYGDIIILTTEPYIDEVAFQIAHIDPEILAHHTSNPSIFWENAELIYEADIVLDYVELVEYPDYTTARYKISDHGIDTIEIEIPKERYYWDIVHPVLSDEAPLYINPRTGNETSPPVGVFWRDYLFNYPDTAEWTVWSGSDTIYEGFVSPVLRQQLEEIEVLWTGKIDTLTDNGAIGIITKWIQDVMVFNSGLHGLNRSIQPIRIYHLHQGRCGEHADITAAAGRACLIPTNSPLTMCNDHTWNEWYDTEWRGWEPVNTFINSSYHYDSWWGGKLVLPFNFRGDGYIWDVTDHCTASLCTLSVIVMDIDSTPVDGARIRLESRGTNPLAGWHYTDSDGIARFIIGDSNPYYARMDAGDIGHYPQPGYMTQIIDSSIAGEHYIWSHCLAGKLPQLYVEPDTLPSNPTDLYKIEIDFDVTQEIVYGITLFNNSLNIHQKFARFVDNGNIEFFVCDSSNFTLYSDGMDFKAFNIGEDVSSGAIDFVIPTQANWYIVFSNEDQVVNSEVISFTARLFKNLTPGMAEVQSSKFKTQSLEIYPNPFSQQTVIRYSLNDYTTTRLTIYDLSGRLVKTLITNHSPLTTAVSWDAKELSSGIYFVRLDNGGRTITKKVVKIR